MMSRSLLLSLGLSLSLLTAPALATEPSSPTDTVAVCETAIPMMRSVMSTLRQGMTLTDDQELVWRVWNTRCRHVSWQQALAEGLPPVPVQPHFGIPMPPPRLTWRDYALAALRGVERAAAAPRSYSTHTGTARIGGRTYTSITTCSASIYGGSCYTSTR